MLRFLKPAAIVAGLIYFASAPGAVAGDPTNPNDVARYLAGMPVSADSPIAKYTRDATWQRHAQFFDSAWKELENRQLSKVRAWSEANLKDRKPTLFYMFSGPDFLYADSFFPGATTYIMAGLEPTGPIPEITERTHNGLANLRASLDSILNVSFFITKSMRGQLNESHIAGTIPVLYVFLERAGKTIREVDLVSVDKEGNLQPREEGRTAQTAPGVKIVFSGSDSVQQTLYYFQTDLSDSGVNNSGFLKFAEKFAPGEGFLKSASYLMHNDEFSKVRQFILDHSRNIVEDDSGIPLRSFKPEEWQFYPFGTYVGPIGVFPGMGQPKLRELFQKNHAAQLDFGVGYRYRGVGSNLLLAVRKNMISTNQ
jgi:hypothetical protein